ncbi:MAG: bifunctional transaldolase/phosoglucose isomerase [Dehalococcoidia bacterium]
MTNPIQETHRLGQAMWIDYIRRGLLKSGEFQRFLDQGISGVTSNPTIFEKAIVGSSDYDEALQARTGVSAGEAYEALAIEDIRTAADLLRPIYDRSGGEHGYASLEVNPQLAYDTEGTIEEGRRLFAALGRPNVMIKVPATPQGIPVIRRLIGEGINVNVTLIFSLAVYREVREAYIAGLEDLAGLGKNTSGAPPASVASFFLSRVDTAVDALLEENRHGGGDAYENKALAGRAAVSSARLAYRDFREDFSRERFAALRAKGARVQRPLWASTGTKNPAYSDLLYVESLIGPDTVNTLPMATINAFLEHGRAGANLEKDLPEAEKTMASLAAAGISLEQVTARLLDEGVKSFTDSFEKLLAGIEEKRAALRSAKVVPPGGGLGEYAAGVESALAGLAERDIVARMWRKDHTVWKPDPTEISNRLGWLTVSDTMSEGAPALQAFAGEIRDGGFRHVVLLGMGGSSLGAEVLRQTFGSAPGYPELIVLDSTVPASVLSVARAIDPVKTLFLVSSKSGGTTEPMYLFRHFRSLVESAAGKGRTGQNFVAITDSGSSLEGLAAEEGFRRTFLNPPDIGGRYSVLSYFGLVPAALIGADIKTLLERADCMREACASCVPYRENPGAWLGAAMGTLALGGRDKLTLITSEAIGSFGLWVEQLIAESTGKEGKGIIPVVGEPLAEPGAYSDDRLFVHLRLKGEEGSATDAAAERIKASGQPVLTLEIKDRYDLGAEFFRWEFATAVAGAIMGIHPFDQPNVQQAKDATERVLREYVASGSLPRAEATGSLADLLAGAGQHSYLAAMAYLHPSPELEGVLAGFRRKLVERYHVATTLGYGPRFLHSTGQLHKGGPDTGLFLQITAGHEEDLPVPGEPFTFGTVADAQALGDLQALQSAGRRVLRVHLTGGGESSIRDLADALA